MKNWILKALSEIFHFLEYFVSRRESVKNRTDFKAPVNDFLFKAGKGGKVFMLGGSEIH